MRHWIWPINMGCFKQRKFYIALIELGLTEMTKGLILKNNNVENLLYHVYYRKV